LDLSGNNLSGQVPVSLKKLEKLTYLYLAGGPGIEPRPPMNENLCLPSELYSWVNSIEFTDAEYLSECTDPPVAEPIDRNILIDLYNATNGPSWKNNTNWLSDKPLSEWYGVGVNAQGQVDSLSLWSNQLSGSIPSSLGNLANLGHLNLMDNQLSGSIPSSLGNLANLESLSLGGNQLSGTVPITLKNLPKLKHLVLALGINKEDNETGRWVEVVKQSGHAPYLGNEDLCLPTEIHDWAKKYLIPTEKNYVAVCDPELAATTDREALVALYNAKNGATWMAPPPPPEFAELTGNWQLTPYFWLSKRPLTVWRDVVTEEEIEDQFLFSPEFFEFSNLWPYYYSAVEKPRPGDGVISRKVVELDFHRLVDMGMKLHPIPPEVFNLTNLRYFKLPTGDDNSGPIPPEIGNLTKLIYLDSGSSYISNISVLSNMTDLRHLDLDGWWLNEDDIAKISSISVLSNLTNLIHLNLSVNKISNISVLSNLTNLIYLDLNNNSISNIAPLVANTGLGSGDTVNLRFNPLSDTSIEKHIPALQDRGVTVYYSR